MTLELRDWQKSALVAVLREKKGIVVAPPATGKTLLGCTFIQAAQIQAMSQGAEMLRAIVLVSTLALRDQWKAEFKDNGFGAAEIPPVLTYQWAAQHADELEGKYDIWVLDETHHLSEAPVYQRVLVPVFQARYALGLTATPPAPDSESLLLEVLPIVYTHFYDVARAAGHVAPIELHPIGVDLTPEERVAYNKFTMDIKGGFKKLGGIPLEAVMRDTRPAAQKVKRAIVRRKGITVGAYNKYAAFMDLMERLKDVQRVLVFSERLEVLETCQALLNEKMISSAIISGETPRLERETMFKVWGRDFPVLLSARVADEGVNVPEVAHAVILAGSKTSRQNLQRQGRLVRPLPGKTAHLYLIYARDTTDDKTREMLEAIING